MDTELNTMFGTISTLFEEFSVEHSKFMNGNSSAGARARKAAGEIKNLITPYRKSSNEIDKNRKAEKKANKAE